MSVPDNGAAHIIRGDARCLPLPDSSVDLIVTSPPYFALRSYQDGGEHYDGQIGSEPTPAEFVAALLEVTRECMRVLKPTGSLWVNLGDKYAANWNSGRATGGAGFKDEGRTRETRTRYPDGTPFRTKTLLGIPWRYALACIDDLGLVLRAEVVWSKPNGLPESVTDRVRRSHEQWFHFTLEPRYFAGIDEIREDYTWTPSPGYKGPATRTVPGQPQHGWSTPLQSNSLGKLPGSVWVVPTEPLVVPDHIAHGRCCDGTPDPDCTDGIDHFAAFPSEWPKRIIQAWSPTGVCVECGEGRRPVATHPCPECSTPWPAQAKACVSCGYSNGDAWKANKDWDNPARLKSADRVPLKPVTSIKTDVVYECACNERIGSPAGTATAADPSHETGRAGFNRPRAEGAGTRVITRWVQRHEAEQLRTSPHREEMAAQVGPQAFAHYIRTDRAGARPIPEATREMWRFKGWLTEVPEFVPPPTTPAVVVDPFGGTGTTAMVAKALGRIGVTVDLSGDYCRIARWRTNDRDQLAKVLDIGKADPRTAAAADTHDSLLDLLPTEETA